MSRAWSSIKDPIHGYIRVNETERTVLDTRPVQRLRRLRQLAGSEFVYLRQTILASSTFSEQCILLVLCLRSSQPTSTRMTRNRCAWQLSYTILVMVRSHTYSNR